MGSLSTTSTTIVNRPTSTTESQVKNIDDFTTRAQITTSLEPKKDDLSIMFLDCKLAITLSAISVAIILCSLL